MQLELVTGGPKLAAGIFRGGPLDGERRPVPEHGPAWVRYHADGATHWYAWKRGSKRTYTYVSTSRRPVPQEARDALRGGRDGQGTNGEAPRRATAA